MNDQIQIQNEDMSVFLIFDVNKRGYPKGAPLYASRSFKSAWKYASKEPTPESVLMLQYVYEKKGGFLQAVYPLETTVTMRPRNIMHALGPPQTPVSWQTPTPVSW